MITDTSYDRGSPAKLMNYLRRDEGRDRDLRDHRGREFDADDREEFREHAIENGMHRHYSINPDPDLDWSDGDLDRGGACDHDRVPDRPALDRILLRDP